MTESTALPEKEGVTENYAVLISRNIGVHPVRVNKRTGLVYQWEATSWTPFSGIPDLTPNGSLYWSRKATGRTPYEAVSRCIEKMDGRRK